MGDKAEYIHDDEYYGPWFRCPHCGNTMIVAESLFCNKCGKPIKCDTPEHWRKREH